MSTEKEFVPYQESLELKELGFDEPCFGWYQESNYGTEKVHVDSHWKTHLSGLEDEDFLSAPTFSQAFRWFREKYNLQSYIRHECPDVEAYYDFVINEDGYDVIKNTYEEAELACLRKLIEIVKQK